MVDLFIFGVWQWLSCFVSMIVIGLLEGLCY
jgi:hypothetical protein